MKVLWWTWVAWHGRGQWGAVMGCQIMLSAVCSGNPSELCKTHVLPSTVAHRCLHMWGIGASRLSRARRPGNCPVSHTWSCRSSLSAHSPGNHSDWQINWLNNVVGGLVLLADAVKNYRSASLLGCKQSVWVIPSHGRKWPSWGGWESVSATSLGPENLYNLWGGVRELHMDLVGESGALSSKGGCHHLSISMGRVLLTQIFILLQTTSCYPVKNRYRQIIKVTYEPFLQVLRTPFHPSFS